MKTDDLREIYEGEQVDPLSIKKAAEEEKGCLFDILKKSVRREVGAEEIPHEHRKTIENRFLKICDVFLPHFAKADLLALRYQNLYAKGSVLIYVMAVVAVLAVAGQYIFDLPHNIIAIEILSIVCILFIIFWGNKVGWHRRWMDYRLLAERFRFVVFMAMVGEKASTKFSRSDLHHGHRRDHWVFDNFRKVWDGWEKENPAHPADPAGIMILKRFIRDAWVERQRDYHDRNIKEQLTRHRLLSIAGAALFVLTLLAVLLHFFRVGGHTLSPYLTFMAILFPAAGSAFSALRTHFEHNRLARRSEAISAHLEGMRRRLEGVSDREGLLSVVREAQELMLNENAEWHVMIGIHHLEPPG